MFVESLVRLTAAHHGYGGGYRRPPNTSPSFLPVKFQSDEGSVSHVPRALVVCSFDGFLRRDLVGCVVLATLVGTLWIEGRVSEEVWKRDKMENDQKHSEGHFDFI